MQNRYHRDRTLDDLPTYEHIKQTKMQKKQKKQTKKQNRRQEKFTYLTEYKYFNKMLRD